MTSTIDEMTQPKKTVQIRVPVALAADVSLCASAFGESPPEYVERKLREAVSEDMGEVARITRQRADAVGTRKTRQRPRKPLTESDPPTE